MRPLKLTEEERESAREVIDLLLDEANDLDRGTLAELWRAHAKHLCETLLPAPGPDVAAISCACCGKAADRIGDLGLLLCERCATADPDPQRRAIAESVGGISELRALYTDHGNGPAPSSEWWALYWTAPTVEVAWQLAHGPGLTSIVGIGPKRAAKIQAALEQHAAERRGVRS